MKREVCVLEKDYKLQNILKKELEPYEITVRSSSNWPEALDATILVIYEDGTRQARKLCGEINRANETVPIIVYSASYTEEYAIEILKSGVNIYVSEHLEILPYTVRNLLTLLEVNRMASPLTGLPGNGQIEREIQKRLQRGSIFAVLYADLDNFKPYNDFYGFLAGDKVLNFTAQVLKSNVKGTYNFIGHIGGDDFVAIVEDGDYKEICSNIISEFDQKIVDYFNEEDLQKGYLEVPNRKGKIERFPLTAISIGVVPVMVPGRYASVTEIAEIGTQMKKYAKKTATSSFEVNKRA